MKLLNYLPRFHYGSFNCFTRLDVLQNNSFECLHCVNTVCSFLCSLVLCYIVLQLQFYSLDEIHPRVGYARISGQNLFSPSMKLYLFFFVKMHCTLTQNTYILGSDLATHHSLWHLHWLLKQTEEAELNSFFVLHLF